VFFFSQRQDYEVVTSGCTQLANDQQVVNIKSNTFRIAGRYRGMLAAGSPACLLAIAQTLSIPQHLDA
jgi:hypothetical protein